MKIGISHLIHKIQVAIVDYGINNVSSVSKALKQCNIEHIITSNPEYLEKCSHIILPGVGSFDSGVENLRINGLDEAIIHAVKNGTYFLGICLGMQLLFEKSEESKKNTRGLGLLKGKSARFNVHDEIIIPHMGWNEVFVRDENEITSIFQKTDQYFIHSFYVIPEDSSVISCECFHGVKFPAIVVKDNIYGVQFHPEKSLKGIQFMEKFCSQ
jgi:imidazole glycerol-phosphate synthase subunit HisH